jgi:DNA-directed RNA polymerase specialized sigma24 family protein
MDAYDTSEPLDQLLESLDAVYQYGDDVRHLVAVDRALANLEHARDLVLIALVGHGHTQAEIAEALGVTQQAVSQQLRHARGRQMQRQFQRKD